MSEITIVTEPEPEPVADAVETASLVIEAVDVVLDAVHESNAADEQHDDNMAFIAGVTVAALDAVIGRVDGLESRVDRLETSQAVVIEAVEEVAEQVAEEPEQTEPIEEPHVEPDEPPDTWKSKASRAWFSKAKK